MTHRLANPRDPRPLAVLDAQLTLDTIPDLEAVRARRAAAAEDCGRRFEVRRSIPYGRLPAETLDLYPAASPQRESPVLLFIHGGFWRSMEAREFSFLAPGFVPFGAALAIIDYPLIPVVRLADIVASCRRAVGWIHANADGHGLDPARIFLAGNSAGGHLVAELIDRAWPAQEGLPATLIKGATAVSGVFDLAPVAASFHNDALRLTPDEVDRFSPLRRDLEIGAELIVAVGGNETDEFLDQSARFAAHARAHGADVEHLIIAGTDHITVVLDALADPAMLLNRAIRRQIGVL